jgi:hypothetical protein
MDYMKGDYNSLTLQQSYLIVCKTSDWLLACMRAGQRLNWDGSNGKEQKRSGRSRWSGACLICANERLFSFSSIERETYL